MPPLTITIASPSIYRKQRPAPPSGVPGGSPAAARPVLRTKLWFSQRYSRPTRRIAPVALPLLLHLSFLSMRHEPLLIVPLGDLHSPVSRFIILHPSFKHPFSKPLPIRSSYVSHLLSRGLCGCLTEPVVLYLPEVVVLSRLALPGD